MNNVEESEFWNDQVIQFLLGVEAVSESIVWTGIFAQKCKALDGTFPSYLPTTFFPVLKDLERQGLVHRIQIEGKEPLWELIAE
jgi:hypothetical protein